MKRKSFGRDAGLTLRMIFTSGLLGLLYVGFAVALLYFAHLQLAPMLVIIALIAVVQYWTSDKIALASAGATLPQTFRASGAFIVAAAALLFVPALAAYITVLKHPDLAASFERSVVESLLEKLDAALRESPFPEVVVCGGVAANTLLRKRVAEVVGNRARLTMPPLELCTDNAAMIAAAGYYSVKAQGPQAATTDPSLGW